MLVRQIADWKLAQFAYLAKLEEQRILGRAHVLDARGAAEFDAGHVPGALHVPHTRIAVTVNTLPADKPYLVYCNSGARAAAAVSMLQRFGLNAIDVNDSFANYRRANQLAARA
jgi:hydroxyacylglutathione hydrolase